MAPALRCLLLAAGILGLAPGTASAAATVELNQAIGVLEITRRRRRRRPHHAAVRDELVVTGTNLDRGRAVRRRRTSVTCPLPPIRMIAVDLAGGDDVFASSRT